MAELVDALGSGPSALRGVEVQVLSRAPFEYNRLERVGDIRGLHFLCSCLFLSLFVGFYQVLLSLLQGALGPNVHIS